MVGVVLLLHKELQDWLNLYFNKTCVTHCVLLYYDMAFFRLILPYFNRIKIVVVQIVLHASIYKCCMRQYASFNELLYD